MVNIDFMNEYLIKQKLKKIKIKMKGIINFELMISNFDFEILENTLKIRNNKNNMLEIIFDEVRNVEVVENNIIIKFNINEAINMEMN